MSHKKEKLTTFGKFIIVLFCIACIYVLALVSWITIERSINYTPHESYSFSVQNPELVSFERRNAARELLKIQAAMAQQERKK